jgi:hypothetical protein
MARIRSIKPEIRTSEKVNSWPIELRYFWILLWGYCDDWGKGRFNYRLIKADAFPLDDSISLETIQDWMEHLIADGVIHKYEVLGNPYFKISNWAEHQRPSHPAKSVIPDHIFCSEESCGNLPQISEIRSPEQRAESREQRAESSRADAFPAENFDEAFDKFWEFYPRKTGKKPARLSFEKALKRATVDDILEGARRYGTDANLPEEQFIPHPTTWLNQDRWTDGPLPLRYGKSNNAKKILEATQGLMSGEMKEIGH